VRPLIARDSKASLRSALRFSQPLDGLLRTLASRAYFISQPRSGLRLVRGFSLRAAALPHRKSSAPLPFPVRTLTEQAQSPRSNVLASRPLSTRSSVCCSLGLTALQTAPLFRFAPPPGTPFSCRLPCLTQGYPLMALSLEPLLALCTLPTASSIFSTRDPACSFPNCRPARDFRAFVSAS
jgi:hypothetical protein